MKLDPLVPVMGWVSVASTSLESSRVQAAQLDQVNALLNLKIFY